MTSLPPVKFVETDLDAISSVEGRIAIFVTSEGKLDPAGRRVNRITKQAVMRVIESSQWEKMKTGQTITLGFPAGMAAKAVSIVKLKRRPSVEEARKAGAALAKVSGSDALTICAGATGRIDQFVLGAMLRGYTFEDHKTGDKSETTEIVVMCSKPDEAARVSQSVSALAEGVFFTRDLVNEPSNILTTQEFADRLESLKDLGLNVEILEEKDLETLGMRALLGVGQGSESPSKVAVMEWKGGGDAKPLVLVGKGVVFDTGGISLKPAGGMEDMTMDMGGAAVVSGVMKALALRGAKANVVGLIGLVENMPDGKAQRPGDVVRSMKGDTIEVINTDAEGRLVLCDVMWYAQDRFDPAAMIDLATLTGAIIISLGHENAGVFSNNDALCNAFLKAAALEGEGAWRMPLGEAYDTLLKSRVADMKNVGGRPAGAIAAAQFLHRFVKQDTPWIHLDIAGTASVKSETRLAPKGATGWGVLALDRLIRNEYEA